MKSEESIKEGELNNKDIKRKEDNKGAEVDNRTVPNDFHSYSYEQCAEAAREFQEKVSRIWKTAVSIVATQYVDDESAKCILSRLLDVSRTPEYALSVLMSSKERNDVNDRHGFNRNDDQQASVCPLSSTDRGHYSTYNANGFTGDNDSKEDIGKAGSHNAPQSSTKIDVRRIKIHPAELDEMIMDEDISRDEAQDHSCDSDVHIVADGGKTILPSNPGHTFDSKDTLALTSPQLNAKVDRELEDSNIDNIKSVNIESAAGAAEFDPRGELVIMDFP